MSAVTHGAPLHRMMRANVTLSGEDEASTPPRRLTYLLEPSYDDG
jgi:hypothetical protein